MKYLQQTNNCVLVGKVEVHDDDWWRMRFEAAGLVYSNALTIDARTMASKDQTLKNLTLDMEDDKLYFVAQHLYLNVQVCSAVLYNTL